MTADQTNSRTWAKLLYRTPENQPYDVAVLRVNPQDVDPSLRSLRLSRVPVVKGKYFALSFSILFYFSILSLTFQKKLILIVFITSNCHPKHLE